MDPTQTLRDLIDALQAGDFESARDLAHMLRAWLARGGFCPSGHTPESVAAYLRSIDRRIDSYGPQPEFTLICMHCDAGEEIASEEQAMLDGWSDVGPAFDLLQANFCGWCPHCKEQ